MEITEQEMQEQDAAAKRYERISDEYRHKLERAWPHTTEGRAAIADMIAENAEHIALLMCDQKWQAEMIELRWAIVRMIERSAQDIIEHSSLSVIQDICETPRPSIDAYDAAIDALGRVC
jgi:hypothetical protein